MTKHRSEKTVEELQRHVPPHHTVGERSTSCSVTLYCERTFKVMLQHTILCENVQHHVLSHSTVRERSASCSQSFESMILKCFIPPSKKLILKQYYYYHYYYYYYYYMSLKLNQCSIIVHWELIPNVLNSRKFFSL